MVRSNKKAKHTGVDFKKVKHKVGRRLPPPTNATKVEVKTKAIVLPEQSLAVEKKGLAVNKKQQTLKELLMQTTHHNANVRKDALYGIKDLFMRHPKEIKLHKLAIIEKLSPRISDADKGVRDSLFLLFKLAVFPGLEEVVMGPLISIIMAHIFNAMTQLATNIRLTAFKFLDLVVQHYESTVIANYSAKVLQYYVDILGKTGNFFQDKGKLMDILAGLIHYLSSLRSSMQPTNSSPDQGKSQLVALHGYKCIVPKKVVAVGIMNISEDGISAVVESLQALLPVLLEEWAECSPSVCSLPNPDNLCLQCMLFILEGFSLIFKCTRTERYGSNQSSYGVGLPTIHMDVEMKKWVKTVHPFLVDRLFSLFPLSPSSYCSPKVQEQFVALNTGICNVALEIAHWVGIDCLPTEHIFRYMKDSLEGQVMPTHHSKSFEKYTVSLICFIPRILSQVADEWKERLLRAFSQAFTSCKPNSSMKLACLSSVEEMLLHDVKDATLEVFQREWIRLLPKLLWELKHDNPDSSRLVLQVLLHVGRSAAAGSLLCKEYTELQPTFMPFFSIHLPMEHNKVKMLYGPFVKLPKVCQELAIDSLHYCSSFSSTFLEALARCCLYSKLDASIVSRIIQMLHRAFGRGCIMLGDHLSFLLTLIVSCKVIHGRILQERHPTLFWSPCAAHVLDLLLEDIGKLDWVSPIVEDARRVTKYIYNHPWVLSLMRKATKGKDLMRPAMTRFATVFLTLQSILDHILALKQMFVCADWVASPYSKKPEGEAVARIVFDENFFAKAKEIVEMSLPLVLVLRICDGQQSPMGGLYEAMDRAKEAVRSYYHRDSLRFDPIWEIIDRRWNNMLHQPIHAAGYFLNPKFRADDSYSDPNGEVMEGLSKCIERMISSEEERDLIVTEQQIYVESRGPLFSSMLAKRARSTQAPDNPKKCAEVSETDPDVSLGFGKYKVITRLVCLCLSELGDESLVLGLIQPVIFQELAHKPSLDITCTLFRVVVVLSSRSMQLPVWLIHDLPQYIYRYLIDTAHDCMMNENSQKTIGGYYIVPCIFLFSRSEKLTSSVFGLLEASSSEGYESNFTQVKHLCAISWVVIQLYKVEHMHYRFLKCQSSTKAILRNINAVQVSVHMSISNEEKETLMKYYSQLKVTTSAVHKWDEKEL